MKSIVYEGKTYSTISDLTDELNVNFGQFYRYIRYFENGEYNKESVKRYFEYVEELKKRKRAVEKRKKYH